MKRSCPQPLLVLIVLCLAAARGWGGPQGEADAGPLVPLLENIGDYSYAVSDCSGPAQQFFDQGLRLTYGFSFSEALASFQEASRLDPDCPMAYWGAAQALSANPNSRYMGWPEDTRGVGSEAIRRALKLADRASERERGLIRAMNVFYDSKALPDRRQRDLAHADAMRALLKQYPDDPEIGTFFAKSLMTLSPWNYWAQDGSPLPGTLEAAEALERVVKRVTDHPGANHYYIHLLENSQTPEAALPHAERLVGTMPGQGHIVHMPTHIYIRTGRYDEAVRGNRASVEVDRAVLAAWEGYPTPPSHAMQHPLHARGFLHMAAVWQGNYAAAIEAARAVASTISLASLEGGPEQQRFVRPWLTAKRFGKWEQILSSNKPAGIPPFVEGIWQFVRGSALLAGERLEEAEQQLKSLRSSRTGDGLDVLMVRVNPAGKLLRIASLVLEGELAAKRGNTERALTLLDQAVRLEDSLAYIEPPDWENPVRHSLGAVLLEAGRAEEAEVVYWEDLRRNRENGWSLYGVWRSLVAQGHTERAAEVEARFRRSWQGADVDLHASRF